MNISDAKLLYLSYDEPSHFKSPYFLNLTIEGWGLWQVKGKASDWKLAASLSIAMNSIQFLVFMSVSEPWPITNQVSQAQTSWAQKVTFGEKKDHR